MSVRMIALMGAFTVMFTGCADMREGTGSVVSTAKPTPAQGYSIHVMAPHKFEDGTVHGPYHHYCKPISRDHSMPPIRID
jgi:hypothetical protein